VQGPPWGEGVQGRLDARSEENDQIIQTGVLNQRGQVSHTYEETLLGIYEFRVILRFVLVLVKKRWMKDQVMQ